MVQEIDKACFCLLLPVFNNFSNSRPVIFFSSNILYTADFDFAKLYNQVIEWRWSVLLFLFKGYTIDTSRFVCSDGYRIGISRLLLLFKSYKYNMIIKTYELTKYNI